MIAHVLEPLVYLVVWSVVAEGGGGSAGGYTTAEFAGYFIMLMLVENVSYTWIMFEYDYRIREGLLSPALLRPVHPIHSDIADNVSPRRVYPCSPWVRAGPDLPPTCRHSCGRWLPPSTAISFLLRFLLEWTLAQAAFWTTRVSAINQSYFVMMLFLSGQVAPLALFPPWLQVTASILPFRWTLGFPVELLLGRLTPAEALIGLGVQAAWVALAYVLMRIVWRAGIRLYSAVGA
jgi:ABC-2 type transport system permease protein